MIGARVLWHHLSDATRSYRVTIGDDGRALCCNCKGATLRHVICRHMAATDKLTANGTLVVQDGRETNDDTDAVTQERDHYFQTQGG